MKEVLDLGLHMCIYPEGTRNKTGMPLKEFHNGAFRLAVETQKPILPALLFNTKKALPLNKFFYFWPAKLEIHFLKPISPANKTTDELKTEVFETMKDYFTSH